MKKIFLISTLVLSSLTFANDKAIYGTDSRIDVNDSNNPAQKYAAHSVAAMIPKFAMQELSDTTVSLADHLSLRDMMGVCDFERFAHQPSISSCTGFLVSPTHLVTAGHCVQTEEDCSSSNWVFDYKLQTGTDERVGNVSKSSVYSCKKIVKSELRRTIFTKKDWAVIELDRPVTNRAPLKLSKKAPSKGDNLYVIGTPSGLPLKIATGVVRSKHFSYFRTNLDSYAGNSGSPVLNIKSNEVEGILVRGDTDYVELFGRCNTSITYKENEGRGEDVSYIKDVRSLLKLK